MGLVKIWFIMGASRLSCFKTKFFLSFGSLSWSHRGPGGDTLGNTAGRRPSYGGLSSLGGSSAQYPYRFVRRRAAMVVLHNAGRGREGVLARVISWVGA